MISNRQKTIARCLFHFIDRAFHPDYSPTDEDWEIYFKRETEGESQIDPKDISRIAGLIEAKGDYDLQIKMVFSEAAEWWANGWGWANPLNSLLDDLAREPEMIPYRQAIEKIYEAFEKDPVTAIDSYTGLSQTEKNKYLKAKAA